MKGYKDAKWRSREAFEEFASSGSMTRRAEMQEMYDPHLDTYDDGEINIRWATWQEAIDYCQYK